MDPLYNPNNYRRQPLRRHSDGSTPVTGYLSLLAIGAAIGLVIGVLALPAIEEDCVPRSEIRRIEIPGVQK